MSEQGKPEDETSTDKPVEAKDSGDQTNATADSPGDQPKTAKTTKPGKPPASGGGRALAALALLLVLVLAGALGAGGYYLWPQWQALQANQSSYLTDADLQPVETRTNEQLKQVEQRLAQRMQQLSVEDQERSRTMVDLQEAVASLQRDQRQQADRMAELRDRLRADGDALLRSEAAFLARTAVHVVRYNQDIDGGLDALKNADELLARKGGQYVAERKAIADAIDALLEVRPPKTDRLAVRLEGLIESVEVLPLARGFEPMSEKPEAETGKDLPPDAGWRDRLNRALARTKDAFGELVVVQKQTNVAPLLSPEQRYFLYHNLRLRLESARLALLAEDEELYDRSLERAQTWLERYYDVESDAVSAAVAEIDSLAEQSVSMALPDIEDRLQTLIELH